MFSTLKTNKLPMIKTLFTLLDLKFLVYFGIFAEVHGFIFNIFTLMPGLKCLSLKSALCKCKWAESSQQLLASEEQWPIVHCESWQLVIALMDIESMLNVFLLQGSGEEERARWATQKRREFFR